jgi:hypothetical protein
MHLLEWFIHTFYERFYSQGQLDCPIFPIFPICRIVLDQGHADKNQEKADRL